MVEEFLTIRDVGWKTVSINLLFTKSITFVKFVRASSMSIISVCENNIKMAKCLNGFLILTKVRFLSL